MPSWSESVTATAGPPARAQTLTAIAARGATYVIPGVLFILAATANGAGYRFGASDQAFYIPAIVRAADPAAFPRDAALIDAQGALFVIDDIAGAAVRATGVPLEWLFLAGYVISLALVWAGVVLIGTHVSRSPWATIAFGAAVTLRHQIPRTSTNSLEPYFHPRILAFGLGTLAIAALLRRRAWIAVALVGSAAVVHVTTALWFAVLIGTALFVLGGRSRRLALIGAAGAAAVLGWAVTAGPLNDGFVVMDGVWLQAVRREDLLFPTGWPAWAWAINAGIFAALWWAHVARARRGEATREDAALVWGATALVALFVAALPLVASAVAIAVQFQVSRVFWLVDFLAIAYAIAALRRRRALIAGLAVALVAFSAVRGVYIMRAERPERALFAVRLPESPWHDAMRWLASQPADVHVLADPDHAWKHGTSVRVSAARDVLLEEGKDSALALYSREVAGRIAERAAAIGDFTTLTPERARELAARYNLDYLVIDAELALPLAYRNEQFWIYALR